MITKGTLMKKEIVPITRLTLSHNDREQMIEFMSVVWKRIRDEHITNSRFISSFIITLEHDLSKEYDTTYDSEPDGWDLLSNILSTALATYAIGSSNSICKLVQ